MEDKDVYAAIGEEGFTRLVAAFYRQVPGDDILGPCTRQTTCKGRKSAFAIS